MVDTLPVRLRYADSFLAMAMRIQRGLAQAQRKAAFIARCRCTPLGETPRACNICQGYATLDGRQAVRQIHQDSLTAILMVGQAA